MDFLNSMKVATSGLKAQSARMRIISENIANSDSTGRAPGADPYQRRIPTFKAKLDRELNAQTVELGKVKLDRSDFGRRYEPGHPAADPQGYVKTPNVNRLVETMDLRDAQRSYEANLNIVTATRRMITKTLEILRT
jgi:flagellar basal-body rod protein FlgC